MYKRVYSCVKVHRRPYLKIKFIYPHVLYLQYDILLSIAIFLRLHETIYESVLILNGLIPIHAHRL